MSLDSRVKIALAKSVQQLKDLKKRVQDLEEQLAADRISHSREIDELKRVHAEELKPSNKKQKRSADVNIPVVETASFLGAKKYCFEEDEDSEGSSSEDEIAKSIGDSLHSTKESSTDTTKITLQELDTSESDSDIDTPRITKDDIDVPASSSDDDALDEVHELDQSDSDDDMSIGHDKSKSIPSPGKSSQERNVFNQLRVAGCRAMTQQRKVMTHTRLQQRKSLSQKHHSEANIVAHLKDSFIEEADETKEIQNTFRNHCAVTVVTSSRKVLCRLAMEVDSMCAWGPQISKSNKQLLLKNISLLSSELGSIVKVASVWGQSVATSVAEEVVSWLQYRLCRSLSLPLNVNKNQPNIIKMSIPSKNVNLLVGEFPEVADPLHAEVVQAWRLRIILSIFVTVLLESEHIHLAPSSLRPSTGFVDTVITLMSNKIAHGSTAEVFSGDAKKYWKESGESDDFIHLHTNVELTDSERMLVSNSAESFVDWPESGSSVCDAITTARLLIGMAFSKLLLKTGPPKAWLAIHTSSHSVQKYVKCCVERAIKVSLMSSSSFGKHLLPLPEMRGIYDGMGVGFDDPSSLWMRMFVCIVNNSCTSENKLEECLSAPWSNQEESGLSVASTFTVACTEIEDSLNPTELYELLVCLLMIPECQVLSSELLARFSSDIDTSIKFADSTILAALCEAEWNLSVKEKRAPHSAFSASLSIIAREQQSSSAVARALLACCEDSSLATTTAAWSNNLNQMWGFGACESQILPIVEVFENTVECWVINLETRKDRWLSMVNQARKLNSAKRPLQSMSMGSSRELKLALSRMCAVEGGTSVRRDEVSESWDSTLNAQYDARCLKQTNMLLSSSERGCAASHLLLWKKLLKSSHDRQIIFEDDAQMSPRFLAGLDQLWSTLDRLETGHVKWDILFLGCLEPQKLKSKKQPRVQIEQSRLPLSFDIIDSPSTIGNKNEHNTHRVHIKPKKGKRKYLLHSPSFIWGLHAYVLRRSGATKLIGSLPVNAPVDVFISSLIQDKTLDALALDVSLVTQDKGLGSDIAHSGMLRRGKDKR